MNSQEEKEALQRIDTLEERMDRMEKAFPEGDVEGHARYHKMVMEEYLERRKIRSAVIEQVVKGTVWATLLFLAGAAWTYTKEHILPQVMRGGS